MRLSHRTSVVLALSVLGLWALGCGGTVSGADAVESADERALDDGLPTAEDLTEAQATESALAGATAAVRHVYGQSVKGQDLEYYKVIPPNPSGKKAFLVFAEHGFEDAWKQDGRALYAIAQKVITAYGTNPAKLNGWTLYVVPTANPDGMRFGTNNFREGTAGAYGRCTSTHRDVNRNVSQGTSHEQLLLRSLFTQVGPDVVVDFHGWYNTYYGNARVGGYFQRAFNAAYDGKPAKYCYTAGNGAEDCTTASLAGVFHGSTSISRDLFAEWTQRVHGVPSALVEFPAPDYNINGVYDSVFDQTLGYRRMRAATLNSMFARVNVALNNLFAGF